MVTPNSIIITPCIVSIYLQRSCIHIMIDNMKKPSSFEVILRVSLKPIFVFLTYSTLSYNYASMVS